MSDKPTHAVPTTTALGEQHRAAGIERRLPWGPFDSVRAVIGFPAWLALALSFTPLGFMDSPWLPADPRLGLAVTVGLPLLWGVRTAADNGWRRGVLSGLGVACWMGFVLVVLWLVLLVAL